MSESSHSKTSKRQQILDTAGDLFMCHGFNGVSVDQIAAAVPVSKPTLYAHFKDKKDLFFNVIAGRCDQALVSLKAGIDDGLTVKQSLESFGIQFLDMLLSREALQFHRLIIGESDVFPEMVDMFYKTGPKRMMSILEDYMRNLHDTKQLNLPNPAMAAEIFIGMIKSEHHFKCLLGIVNAADITENERKMFIQNIVQIFMNGQKV